jgi:hypothetical protein
VKSDQRKSFGAKGGRVLKPQVEIQLSLFSLAIVPLLAGDLTCPAADALGNVDQCGLNRWSGTRGRHDLLPLILGAAVAGASAFNTFTRQAFVS